MIIKQPTDHRPLRNLIRFFDNIDRRARRCRGANHRFISLIYLSSYIFSELVIINGRRLDEVLRSLATCYGSDVICLIRTIAPNCIPSFRYHRGFLESLRDCCYIIVYDDEREFLNHAKFIVWIHVCLDEGIIYRSLYYGSTNFTCRGLAVDNSGKGNFEEYYSSRVEAHSIDHLRPRFARSLLFYLRDAYSLLHHEANMYSEDQYIKRMLLNHLSGLKDVIDEVDRVLRGTTLLDLYNAFIRGYTWYLSILALLDQLPGKRLTRKITSSLIRLKEPMMPLMLEEMTIPYRDKLIEEIIAKYYEDRYVYLREELKYLVNTLKEAYEKITEYLKALKNSPNFENFLGIYGDNKEWTLKRRIVDLKKTIKIIEEVIGIVEKQAKIT